ncbi:MAG: ABC transporter ATP-binding protein [Pseudomonadota bacterium]
MRAANLTAENISWHPHRGAPKLVQETSFQVNAGDVMGVVGPNGAGKSTLLRMIYRYQKPTTGVIKIEGEDIWAMPAKQAAQKIAAVLQEQPSSFGLTVREVVTLGRTPHRTGFAASGANDMALVDGVLEQLNLTEVAHRDLGTLSGGERQRVMVARALVQEPQVLVLDEPTNHLDIRHQLEVLALIKDLDLTIIVSLHDLNMAGDICDSILLLDAGHTRGFGTPEEVLTEARVSDAFAVNARQEMLRPSNTKHLSFHLPN